MRRMTSGGSPRPLVIGLCNTFRSSNLFVDAHIDCFVVKTGCRSTRKRIIKLHESVNQRSQRCAEGLGPLIWRLEYWIQVESTGTVEEMEVVRSLRVEVADTAAPEVPRQSKKQTPKNENAQPHNGLIFVSPT